MNSHPRTDSTLKTDPKVVAAVSKCVQPTITAHEVDKVYRRAAKRWKYKQLYKWFDKISDKSGEWRVCLVSLLAKWGEPVQVTLNATTVDSTAPWESYLADQMTSIKALVKLYHEAYETAEAAGDSTTASKLCDIQDDAEGVVAKLEAFARQILDQGIKNWLGTMK